MKRKISVVVPLYNEESIVDTLCELLGKLAERSSHEFEFVFVNDGSSDRTLDRLAAAAERDPRIVVVDLSRNFGQHPALSAGIDHSTGDAVVLMDADLEDNPDHVLKLIAAWEEGWEVVYAVRGKRQGGWFRRLCSKLFHELNRRMEAHMPMAGTFGLMDRRVVNAMAKLPEKNRYIPGLRSIVGFKQKGILLDRGSRYDRRPRVSFFRLIRLAMDAYVAYSKLPLKLASGLGLFFSFVGFCAICFLVVYQLLLGFSITGWASTMVTVIFASGVQLLCMGILGEYVSQILDETKARPVYLVRSVFHGARTPKAGAKRGHHDGKP